MALRCFSSDGRTLQQGDCSERVWTHAWAALGFGQDYFIERAHGLFSRPSIKCSRRAKLMNMASSKVAKRHHFGCSLPTRCLVGHGAQNPTPCPTHAAPHTTRIGIVDLLDTILTHSHRYHVQIDNRNYFDGKPAGSQTKSHTHRPASRALSPVCNGKRHVHEPCRVAR